MTLSTTATLEEISDELGYAGDLAMVRAKMFKVPFKTVPNPDGGPGKVVFAIEDAIELVKRCRDLDEDHRQKWFAYQAYVKSEQEKAVREEREALLKARAEAEQRYAKQAEETRRKRQQEAMAVAAERSAADARRRGDPMAFEKFVKKMARS